MTALAEIQQEEIVLMATHAQVTMLAGRIVKIEISPSGKCMEEMHNCECIIHDFLGHGKPSEYFIRENQIVFSCDSGDFYFLVDCDEETMEKLVKQIEFKQFYFMGSGCIFSLNI